MTAAKTTLKAWEKAHKDIKRSSWEEHFILQAYLASTRSLDARTRCGAVITSPEKDVIATGYNSFVRDIDDRVLPNSGDAKYDFMIHAEHNAVLACARHGKSCKGAHLYSTGRPCLNCLQFAYQAGVSKLYYLNHNFHKGFESETMKFNILVSLMQDNMRIIQIEPSEILLENIETIQNLRV
jgi:dCMP deaminase